MTKKNVSSSGGGGNGSDLLAAAHALGEALAVDDAQLVKRHAKELLECLDDLGIFSGGSSTSAGPRDGATVHDLDTEEGRIAAGVQITRKQTGRNDHGRDPAGYSLVDGELMSKTISIGAPEPRTVAVAQALLMSIGRYFQTPNAKGIPIGALLATAQPRQALRNHSAAVEAAWAAYVGGMDGGRYAWERALEGQLEMDARHREAARLRAARGIPDPESADVELLVTLGTEAAKIPDGSFFAPATGEEMHAYLIYTGIDLPAELTPAAIEAMRASVGLNKGGPAKKRTARSVVDDFSKHIKSLTK